MSEYFESTNESDRQPKSESPSVFTPPLRQPSTESSTSSVVECPARIAVYDDLLATPRLITIEPMRVDKFLDEVSQTTYNVAKQAGGTIAYSPIREVVENFIHAFFREPTISIMDHGNTIRFSDQGPGIKRPNMAFEVGYTSATESMKRYIRGVGSGLPIAREYLTYQGGYLTIDENIERGTVVTISVAQPETYPQNTTQHTPQATPLMSSTTQSVTPQTTPLTGQPINQPPITQPVMGQPATSQQATPYGIQPMVQPPVQPLAAQGVQPTQGMQDVQPVQQNMYLSDRGQYVQSPYSVAQQPVIQPQPLSQFTALQPNEREKEVLGIMVQLHRVGPRDIAERLNCSESTAHRTLISMEEKGFVEQSEGRNTKRTLTNLGYQVYEALQAHGI